ncbi:MAG: hypothetical protein MR639_07390, partial [Clostridium sp.]|uniref:hypothetical protein n=1 Tax=Clostridium sp. TaxID=1506 RepID=UPI003216B212|nr:hypothetical protein [Clostridium sp.]
EISHICNCSERTIRRKLKEIRDEKQEEELNRLKLLGVSIEVLNDNKKKVRYKRVYNKNEIIKSYLDGYTAREIEDKYGYFRDEVYNIIRNLKRKIGFSKFKELYEKIHKKNREKLLLEREKEKYNRDILKLTRLEVNGYIGDEALFSSVKSAYRIRGRDLVLTNDCKEIATWDLPRIYK